MTAFDIVLVEDNDDHAQLLELCLLRTGRDVAVRRFANGEQMLAALLGVAPAQRMPDLVLMDINMPGIDGIEATRRLKSDPRTRRIPVVILTTSSAEGDLRRALEVHANSFAVKDVGFSELRDSIATLVHYWTGVHLGGPGLR